MNDYQALHEFRNRVELLRRDNPEMDEDNILFAHMVEGETNFGDLVQKFVRQYFAAKTLKDANERHFERKCHYWKERIREHRTVAHFTESQRFPEATVFESKPPDKVIYDYAQIPDKFKKVDETALRAALKNGESIPSASLIPSNEPKQLNIRIK
jgi:16S rRNA C967 or C1407 C5-methylase (RsmB/RsmF family)